MTVAKVNGVKKVTETFQRVSEQYQGAKYVIGFTAPYAVYVHENLNARHTNGEAKFLENATRLYAKAAAAMIANMLKNGKTVSQAVMAGGLVILGQAQKRCPVLTGRLKRSGFVKVEQE